ncbi:MAG: hypothetical protein G8345_12335 [Magnetococcales bacterium]|nr:hypothetical protein [Magnetococcales bacterium]NGZ27661.1 hypothetical protein [Magnetococcales bacterium]
MEEEEEEQVEAGVWDCRWPDPVALRVASERILDGLSGSRTDVNWRIGLQVEMEGVPAPGGFPNALLISPWGVERVYWSPFGTEAPPIQSAAPLVADDQGRVAAGQGVLLLTEPKPTPVLIGWEPETGHHFIQSLIGNMLPYEDGHQAMMAAFAVEKRGGSWVAASTGGVVEEEPSRLQKPVSRRGMFGFLRR